MAALSTAIIAASVVGAGAAVYSGSQNAKAIKNAANQSQQASNQALQFQRGWQLSTECRCRLQF